VTSADPRSDTELLAAHAAGDPDAFGEVVRRHRDRLWAVALRTLGDREEAADAVQDALVSALRASGPRPADGTAGAAFRGESAVTTWLHRIVVNACLMRIRRRERKPEESIDDFLPAYEADGHTVEKFQPWGNSAIERLEKQETHALVRASIDRLPETYRTALLLRDIEEMDSEEAAAVLGITPNALKIRVHRARQALRTLLDPHFGRPGENRRAEC